jgi:hypothetical protein
MVQMSGVLRELKANPHFIPRVSCPYPGKGKRPRSEDRILNSGSLVASHPSFCSADLQAACLPVKPPGWVGAEHGSLASEFVAIPSANPPQKYLRRHQIPLSHPVSCILNRSNMYCLRALLITSFNAQLYSLSFTVTTQNQIFSRHVPVRAPQYYYQGVK